MMEHYLARPWDEVRQRLIEEKIPFSWATTEPPDRRGAEGRYRVARVRKTKECWEFILTREKVEMSRGDDPL